MSPVAGFSRVTLAPGIPATVLSRCQRHEFRRVPVGEIVTNLKKIGNAEKIHADDDALIQIALLGTERQPPPEAISSATPLGQLQQQSISPNREQTLLSLAALASIHERIGSLPPSEGRDAPSSAPLESASRASDHAGAFLQRLLKGDFSSVATDLISEWLRIAAATNQLVPPQLLPLLLEAGSEKRELRTFFGATVGARGQWLARPAGRRRRPQR